MIWWGSYPGKIEVSMWLIVLLTQTWFSLVLLNLPNRPLEGWWNMRCSLHPSSHWKSQQFKLPLSCLLQTSCRFVSEYKAKDNTSPLQRKKTQVNPQKTYQKHNQSYWRLNVCSYLVIKVLAPYISTAPSQQVPCVQFVFESSDAIFDIPLDQGSVY